MNVGGGEAADQLVRMMLAGVEVSVRLGGSALKNTLALTLALAKNNKTISGKVNLGKMLRETRDLRQFPMTPEQYKQFAKLAKKHKILFSAIRDKDDLGKLTDVILPVTELDRANLILERIKYQEPTRQPVQRHRRRRRRRGAISRLVDRGRQGCIDFLYNSFEKLNTALEQRNQRRRRPDPEQSKQDQQEQTDPQFSGALSKKDSRSGRDSPGTNTRSFTSRENADTRTTNERPSVLDRLKQYRTQLDNKVKPVLTRSKAKARPKQR